MRSFAVTSVGGVRGNCSSVVIPRSQGIRATKKLTLSSDGRRSAAGNGRAQAGSIGNKDKKHRRPNYEEGE